MQFLFTDFCCVCRALATARIVRKIMSNSTVVPEKTVLEENMKVLKKLGFKEREMGKVYKYIFLTGTEPRLKIRLKRLQALGLTLNEIKNNIQILKHPPSKIDHRLKVLEEGGFYLKKITVSSLLKFSASISPSILELKSADLIDKQVSVTRHILSHSDFPPELCPPEVDESKSYEDVHSFAYKTYLTWKFTKSYEQVDSAFKTYNSLSRKSLILTVANYNFLANVIGLSHEQISSNLYLLAHHPYDFSDTLERVPFFGPIPFQVIGKTNPRVLMRPAEILLSMVELLKELKLPLETIKMYSDILLLSTRTIRERMRTLQEDPNFSPYLNNPRVLKAIIHFQNVIKRYKLLNDINWRCQSFDMLSVRPKVFQSRLKMGSDISKGNDVVHFLHKELGKDRPDIRSALWQNPVWHVVPLSTVTENLQQLQDKGFTLSQIWDALTVLLYPREEVEKCLAEMDARPELACCRDEQSGRLKPELVLQLVLYYLERPYHFNGNGIFTGQPLPNHELVNMLNFDKITDK